MILDIYGSATVASALHSARGDFAPSKEFDPLICLTRPKAKDTLLFTKTLAGWASCLGDVDQRVRSTMKMNASFSKF